MTFHILSPISMVCSVSTKLPTAVVRSNAGLYAADADADADTCPVVSVPPEESDDEPIDFGSAATNCSS